MPPAARKLMASKVAAPFSELPYGGLGRNVVHTHPVIHSIPPTALITLTCRDWPKLPSFSFWVLRRAFDAVSM